MDLENRSRGRRWVEYVIAGEFRAVGRQPPTFDWGLGPSPETARLFAIAPSKVATLDLTGEMLQGEASEVEARVREWVRQHLLTGDPSGPLWK